MVGTCCCAVGCSNKTPAFKLFAIPTGKQNKMRRKIWLQNISRKNFNPSCKSNLCEKHFTDDQFEKLCPYKKLRKDAIPSLFQHRKISTEDLRKQISCLNIYGQTKCKPMAKYAFLSSSEKLTKSMPLKKNMLPSNTKISIASARAIINQLQTLASSKKNTKSMPLTKNTFPSNAEIKIVSVSSISNQIQSLPSSTCPLPKVSITQLAPSVVTSPIQDPSPTSLLRTATAMNKTSEKQPESDNLPQDVASHIVSSCASPLKYTENNAEDSEPQSAHVESKSAGCQTEESYDELLRKVQALQRQVRKLTSEKEQITKSMKDIFTEDQVRALQFEKGAHIKWSSDTIEKALEIRKVCKDKGYKYLLASGQPLPTLRTLNRRIADAKLRQNEIGQDLVTIAGDELDDD